MALHGHGAHGPADAERTFYYRGMIDPEPPRRQGSDVLDAIWEKVEQKPARTDSATLLFRSKALDQLDVAAEVDNQLPLVSRRSWLLLVGVGALVAALLLWAAQTPSITSVAAPGRVVASPGVSQVVSSAAGVVTSVDVSPGATVAPGQEVATVSRDNEQIRVQAVVGGVVWQVQAMPGDDVAVGGTVLTLLPPNSGRSVILAVPEPEATSVRPGMNVDVFAGARNSGVVAQLSAPMPGEDASGQIELALDPQVNYVLVSVDLAGPMEPGMLVSGQIVLSDSTVLGRVLGGT